jgi:hypothetical protein
MRQHREVFQHLHKHTGMWLSDETYAAAEAFVAGYDAACEGGVLAGFREWLVMRVGSGGNLAWPALVLDLAFPQVTSPRDALSEGAKAHRHAIDTLFGLLAEFDEERAKHDGLRRIYAAYEEWLQKQDWARPTDDGRKASSRRKSSR